MITVDPIAGNRGLRAVGENSAVLNKGTVGEGSVGYEYSRRRAHRESDDGAMFGKKVSKNRFELRRRFAQ